MTLDEAQHSLRSGEGDIRLIIDWLATTQDASSLLPLLHEEGARESVLYVYSELPSGRIAVNMFKAIEDLLPELAVGSPERAWAQEILAER